MLGLYLSLLLLALPAPSRAGQAAKDPVMDAMVRELDRSFAGLRHKEKVPLYYMEYELTVSTRGQISANMGALEYSGVTPGAVLDIDMRVNSMALDNTHQVKGSMSWGNYSRSQSFPVALDGDEAAIRARLWEYTDKTYKEAEERFTKVEMNKAVTAAEEDPSPDFSTAPAEHFYETVTPPQPDVKAWGERLRRLSARFEGLPFVYGSGVWLSWNNVNRYIVNSDGTRVKTGNNYVTLGYSLMSRTTDGMDLTRTRQYNGDSLADMPSDVKVLSDMDRSIKELEALRAAPLVEPYSGPAILKARAAAVYFHEIIGHRLEGHRQKLEDSGQTFARKVGQKVTSPIVSLYDDPTLREFDGIPLRGYYRFDDEGVKARRVTLVKDGVLKGFLMSRSPIRGFPSSNGHGRRSPGHDVVSRMGNTIMVASKTVSYPELRKMLIEECREQGKPFGLVFDDISGGETNTERGGPQAFNVFPLLVHKVFTDGRPDQVVRGVNIVGTPLTSFSEIQAAANDPDVFNGTCGAESGWVPVSAISPSVLLGDIEVEKAPKSQQKPPVLPPPQAYGGK